MHCILSTKKLKGILPEGVLGHTRGLFHECVFKDLLPVDLLFQRAARDESVNDHGLLLTNAVHPVYKQTQLIR